MVDESLKLSVVLRQISAFVKRDFRDWRTYRTQVITQLITIAIGILSWAINAVYRNRPVPEYDTDYISFLVVGLVIGNLVMPISQGLERRLNPWTLENIIMTGIPIPIFVVGHIAWPYIFSLATFIPQLLIGIFWFGVNLRVNILSTVLAFIISAMILLGLAMISIGFRLVTKSTDPITWTINTLQQLLAGISFPVQFLDTFIPGVSNLSWFLPQTWVYHLWRLAILKAAPITDPIILLEFLKGSAFAVILFPMGYRVFRWGLDRARRDGTLGWF
ncbi:MAG: ABC transporter permease [Candidatus Bathyarchaeia archaeon]